jgi:fatty acid desaturase
MNAQTSKPAPITGVPSNESGGERSKMSALERQQVAAIRVAIKARRDEIFARHPLLKHQDAIGTFLCLASVGGIVALALAYRVSMVPAWLCILGVAFLGSVLHELEHDLIHDLYFSNRPWVQHTMFAVGWLFRPNMVNPWLRKVIHLHHHRASGTKTDVEELAATNGIPMGLRRLLLMNGRLARRLLSRRPSKPIVISGVTVRHSWRDLPVTIYEALLVVWLASLVARGAVAVFGHAGQAGWMADAAGVLDYLAVVLIVPCLLRNFALMFMTSNNHYHGDVTNLLEETQVLNHWVFSPLNLLCFNFGATHTIHHFVVNQPFYVRQWLASSVYGTLRENGVRFNDLGTFARANRYQRNAEAGV